MSEQLHPTHKPYLPLPTVGAEIAAIKLTPTNEVTRFWVRDWLEVNNIDFTEDAIISEDGRLMVRKNFTEDQSQMGGNPNVPFTVSLLFNERGLPEEMRTDRLGETNLAPSTVIRFAWSNIENGRARCTNASYFLKAADGKLLQTYEVHIGVDGRPVDTTFPDSQEIKNAFYGAMNTPSPLVPYHDVDFDAVAQTIRGYEPAMQALRDKDGSLIGFRVFFLSGVAMDNGGLSSVDIALEADEKGRKRISRLEALVVLSSPNGIPRSEGAKYRSARKLLYDDQDRFIQRDSLTPPHIRVRYNFVEIPLQNAILRAYDIEREEVDPATQQPVPSAEREAYDFYSSILTNPGNAFMMSQQHFIGVSITEERQTTPDGTRIIRRVQLPNLPYQEVVVKLLIDTAGENHVEGMRLEFREIDMSVARQRNDELRQLYETTPPRFPSPVDPTTGGPTNAAFADFMRRQRGETRLLLTERLRTLLYQSPTTPNFKFYLERIFTDLFSRGRSPEGRALLDEQEAMLEIIGDSDSSGIFRPESARETEKRAYFRAKEEIARGVDHLSAIDDAGRIVQGEGSLAQIQEKLLTWRQAFIQLHGEDPDT